MPSIEEEINKVTTDKTQDEDWSAIIEICHKITVSTGSTAQTYLNIIMKKVKHLNPNVSMKAITVLDACYSNCGKKFQKLMSTRAFTDELRRLLGHISPLHERVKDRLKGHLQNWAREMENDPEMNLLCVAFQMLKKEGVIFPEATGTAMPSTATTTKTTDSQTQKKEDEDLKKAIAASLVETAKPRTRTGSFSSPSNTASSLYPNMLGELDNAGINITRQKTPSPRTERKAEKYEALFNFTADEDNELSFKEGDVVEVLDSSDENWWKGKLRGKTGLFPATFVSKYRRGESQAKKEREKEKKEKEKRAQNVEINEEKLDLTLEMLKKADAHSEESVESVTIKKLEEECEAMRPIIKQKIDYFHSKYESLLELNSEFQNAMALYQKMLRESTNTYIQQQQMNIPAAPINTYSQLPPGLLAQTSHSVPQISQNIQTQPLSLLTQQQPYCLSQQQPPILLTRQQPPSLLLQQQPTSLLPQQQPSSLLPQQQPSSLLPQQQPSSLLPQQPPSLISQQQPPSLLPQPPSFLPQQQPPSLLSQQQPPSLLSQQQPPNLLSQQQPPNLLSQQQPPNFLSQQPSSLLSQQQPPSLLSQQQPPILLSQQQPPSLLSQQQPPSLLSQQQPPSLLSQQQPPNLFSQQQPPNLLSQQQPPSLLPQQQPPSLLSQQPPSLFSQQQPPNLFSQQQPPSLFSQQQPPNLLSQQQPSSLLFQQQQQQPTLLESQIPQLASLMSQQTLSSGLFAQIQQNPSLLTQTIPGINSNKEPSATSTTTNVFSQLNPQIYHLNSSQSTDSNQLAPPYNPMLPQILTAQHPIPIGPPPPGYIHLGQPTSDQLLLP